MNCIITPLARVPFITILRARRMCIRLPVAKRIVGRSGAATDSAVRIDSRLADGVQFDVPVRTMAALDRQSALPVEVRRTMLRSDKRSGFKD